MPLARAQTHAKTATPRFIASTRSLLIQQMVLKRGGSEARAAKQRLNLGNVVAPVAPDRLAGGVFVQSGVKGPHSICRPSFAILIGSAEENHMATSVKQMLEAANAAVPKITPDQASDMIKQGNTLVVDVRDAPEVAASGKVAGAVNVSRGMLEFRADPESPYHDKNFDKGKTVILYCASGGRSALAGKVLKDMGYDKVYNVGGFKDWTGAVEKA